MNEDGILIVASDGLFRHANAEAIAECCRGGTMSEIVDRLVRQPMLRSGRYPDDVVTVAVGAF